MSEEEQPKNVVIRPGIVDFMEGPEIIGGLIRFGKKTYKVVDNHPVEVNEACGADCDPGDCSCNTGRCCP